MTGLDYEAFEEMALETLRTIGAEIAERFGVRRLAMIHRVGRVAVGEPSVVIAAAAAHRGAAFDATALRHRGAQGAGADLEGRAFCRRVGLDRRAGARGPAELKRGGLSKW